MRTKAEPNPIEAKLNPPLLRVAKLNGHGGEFQLIQGESTFAGSASSCRIRLNCDSVAQFHCMFSLNHDGLLVQDCGTGGQTLVNGIRLGADIALKHGDQLSIGNFTAEVILTDDVRPELKDSAGLSDPPPAQTVATPVSSDSLSSATDSSMICLQPQPLIGRQQQEAFPSGRDPLDDVDDGWTADGWPVSASNGELDESGTFEELQLLRAEIESLQSELALRDVGANRTGFDAASECGEVSSDHEQETVRLVNRLEELLNEMSLADERARTMDDLLRASEEANQAEQEERRQIESWLGEIEKRVSQRQDEMEADAEKLRKRCDAVDQARARAEGQLRKLVSQESGNSNDSPAEIGQHRQLTERIDQLERQLELTQSENIDLKSQLAAIQAQDNSHELRALEQKLAATELGTSRERAEIARQRAEFENARSEFEQKYQQKTETAETDSRFAAMRQHLREIHEEEKSLEQERRKNSLSGRIAKLLSRV